MISIKFILSFYVSSAGHTVNKKKKHVLGNSYHFSATQKKNGFYLYVDGTYLQDKS